MKRTRVMWKRLLFFCVPVIFVWTRTGTERLPMLFASIVYGLVRNMEETTEDR